MATLWLNTEDKLFDDSHLDAGVEDYLRMDTIEDDDDDENNDTPMGIEDDNPLEEDGEEISEDDIDDDEDDKDDEDDE
jgi:hypothetical protein